MIWFHRYRPIDIGSNEIVHEHEPGRKLAEAVTEIQERCVVDVETQGDGSAAISGNTLTIVFGDGTAGAGAGLPEGGEQYQVLQRDSAGEAVWDFVRAH
jgi:hypothetical protein